MSLQIAYSLRPARFLEVYEYKDWKIKLYSISVKNEFVAGFLVDAAKEQIPLWLKTSVNYDLEIHKIAVLILHEGREGNFAVINWWIDGNMIQNHVYKSNYNTPFKFESYSDGGIIFCTWELAVMCFERNAWVEHVLKKVPEPDFEKYLEMQFNDEV